MGTKDCAHEQLFPSLMTNIVKDWGRLMNVGSLAFGSFSKMKQGKFKAQYRG